MLGSYIDTVANLKRSFLRFSNSQRARELLVHQFTHIVNIENRSKAVSGKYAKVVNKVQDLQKALYVCLIPTTTDKKAFEEM